MKKRLIVVMLVGILSLSIVGCSRKDTVQSNGGNTNVRFIVTGDVYVVGNMFYSVVYDSKTKPNIVYLSNDIAQQGAITVVYDSDGKPMTLDKYNQTK